MIWYVVPIWFAELPLILYIIQLCTPKVVLPLSSFKINRETLSYRVAVHTIGKLKAIIVVVIMVAFPVILMFTVTGVEGDLLRGRRNDSNR